LGDVQWGHLMTHEQTEVFSWNHQTSTWFPHFPGKKLGIQPDFDNFGWIISQTYGHHPNMK
jgi:hypothetical protein